MLRGPPAVRTARYGLKLTQETHFYKGAVCMSISYHIRYAPLTVDEICGNEIALRELDNVLRHATQSRLVLCTGPSGSGMTTGIRLLLRGMKFTIREITCSNGFTDVASALTANTDHVLDSLCECQTRVAYILRDINTFNKPQRAVLMSLLRKIDGCHAILIHHQSKLANITPPHIISFVPPEEHDLVNLLWWVVYEENLCVTDEYITSLAKFCNVRSALTALQARTTSSCDIASMDEYTYAHVTHETLRCAQMADVAHFLDAMSLHLMTMGTDMFVQGAGAFARSRFGVPGFKTTSSAHHAQVCNRASQLRSASRDIGLQCVAEDMDLATHILRSNILSGAPLPGMTETEAQAMYVLTRRNTPTAKCRILKRRLRR